MTTARVKPEYAHIASLIRSELSKRDMSVMQLNELLGIERLRTTVYPWLKATGAPAPKFRKKLSKIFSLPETMFMPKEAKSLARSTAIVKYSPGKIRQAQSKPDPLFFKILNDNTAQIQFNATLPIEQAKSLMRMLLDFNVK
jgi:transcriptional regulator with XRE-family HTH domain